MPAARKPAAKAAPKPATPAAPVVTDDEDLVEDLDSDGYGGIDARLVAAIVAGMSRDGNLHVIGRGILPKDPTTQDYLPVTHNLPDDVKTAVREALGDLRHKPNGKGGWEAVVGTETVYVLKGEDGKARRVKRGTEGAVKTFRVYWRKPTKLYDGTN